MKRILLPAVGAALLQIAGTPPALANNEWDLYASSGYEYCDAVMLGAVWGEAVDDAKMTIGRKIGWGNADIVENNLNTARRRGVRCDFHDTGFVYEDAEALAYLWDVSIDEAKVALAEKVSTGWRHLANEVVAEAHQNY